MSRSLFRKLAPVVWPSAAEASIHAHYDLDLTAYYKRFPEAMGSSPFALVIYLLNEALKDISEFHKILIWKYFFSKRQLSFVVPIDSESHDLKFVRIEPPAEFEFSDALQIFKRSHDQFKKQSDQQMGWSYRVLRYMPGPLVALFIKIFTFAIYELRLPAKIFGFKAEPFGPVVVSNYGSLGLKRASVPLIPICRNIVTIGIGRLESQGDRHVLPMTLTVDHRYVDGSHCSKAMRILEESLHRLCR